MMINHIDGTKGFVAFSGEAPSTEPAIVTNNSVTLFLTFRGGLFIRFNAPCHKLTNNNGVIVYTCLS